MFIFAQKEKKKSSSGDTVEKRKTYLRRIEKIFMNRSKEIRRFNCYHEQLHKLKLLIDLFFKPKKT